MREPLKTWEEYILEGWEPDFLDEKSGGFLVVHPLHGRMELAQNRVVGRMLASFGEAVALLPGLSNRPSPDAFRNEIEWEFKQVFNAQNIARGIEHALRRGKYQAPNLLCFLPVGYPNREMTRGIFNAVKFDSGCLIQRIDILFEDGKLLKMDREIIQNGNFASLFH